MLCMVPPPAAAGDAARAQGGGARLAAAEALGKGCWPVGALRHVQLPGLQGSGVGTVQGLAVPSQAHDRQAVVHIHRLAGHCTQGQQKQGVQAEARHTK